jgi:hypothetical protein
VQLFVRVFIARFNQNKTRCRINPDWVFITKLPAVIYIYNFQVVTVSAIAGTPVFRMPSIYEQIVTVSAIAGTPSFRMPSIYHQVVTVSAIAGTPVFRMPSIYQQVVKVSAIAGTPPTISLLSARCLTSPAMLRA